MPPTEVYRGKERPGIDEEAWHQALVRLGDRINAYRVARDKTQRELAAELGLTYSYLGGIEAAQDGRVPSLRTLFRIASGLGLELEDLFYGPENDGGEEAA